MIMHKERENILKKMELTIKDIGNKISNKDMEFKLWKNQNIKVISKKEKNMDLEN